MLQHTSKAKKACREHVGLVGLNDETARKIVTLTKDRVVALRNDINKESAAFIGKLWMATSANSCMVIVTLTCLRLSSVATGNLPGTYLSYNNMQCSINVSLHNM